MREPQYLGARTSLVMEKEVGLQVSAKKNTIFKKKKQFQPKNHCVLMEMDWSFMRSFSSFVAGKFTLSLWDLQGFGTSLVCVIFYY